MKTAISYFFIFISLNTFASTTTQDFTGKYELISGDQDCAQNLRLSSYFDDELTVDNLETSNLLLGFSSINEGVTSKISW